MKSKALKIINEKQRNLDKLNIASNQIVNEAFSYVRSLEHVNEEIVAERLEIEDLKKQLMETDEGLQDVHSRNSKLIGNFKKLFEV